MVAADWAEGMGASLRAGLAALDGGADAVVVTLVDLPDLTAEVVRRVVAAATGPGDLARATYAGTPGHPVLIGRDHWDGRPRDRRRRQGSARLPGRPRGRWPSSAATWPPAGTSTRHARGPSTQPTVADADELGRVHVRDLAAGLRRPDAGRLPRRAGRPRRSRRSGARGWPTRSPASSGWCARDETRDRRLHRRPGRRASTTPPADLELYAINLLARARGTGLGRRAARRDHRRPGGVPVGDRGQRAGDRVLPSAAASPTTAGATSTGERRDARSAWSGRDRSQPHGQRPPQ